MTDHYSEFLESLLNGPEAPALAHDDAFARDNALLGQEYLRRAAVWVDAIGDRSQWPFGRLIESAVPGLDLSEDDTAVREDATKLRQKYSLHFIMRNQIYHFLLWEKYKHQIPDDLTSRGLPDPYEPLLQIFKRGGFFYLTHGWIDFQPKAFIIGAPEKWLPKEPLKE